MTNRQVVPGSWHAWMVYIRPKTWGVAVAPVAAALALAFAEIGGLNIGVACATLSMAVLMQIITNMQNDRGYTQRKAETGNRKGLPRATANGWLTMKQARIGLWAAVAAGALNTALLILVGGKTFLLIGVASILAAYAYMGGPKPIAYTPFGEIVVLLFFGLTAVCGTYYLQAGGLSVNAVLLGVGLGAVAAAVLAVNNWRDREHDRSVGRRTLAVVAGEQTFSILFSAMLFAPFLVTLVMVVRTPELWPVLTTLVLLGEVTRLRRELHSLRGLALNETLFATVMLEVKFAFLFAFCVGGAVLFRGLT